MIRLDDLLADPARVAEVLPEAVPVLLGRLELLKARLVGLASAAPTSITSGPAADDPPYTLDEAAMRVHKSRAWVRREAAAGRIPCARKVGRSWHFPRNEFDAFWRRHRSP